MNRDPNSARAAAPRLVALALAALALSFAAWGLWRLNTWYLASDQFAFLTFARDLRAGRIFHPDETLELISPEGRRGGSTRDALAQTYYWRDGRLYSRYPPGFPAVLALAGLVAGETGEHALNPLLYLLTLVVLAILTRALLLARPRAREGEGDDADDSALADGAAVAAMWLFLLLPTQVHLWGITVVRDLPAHLLALLALLAAARGRLVWSGVALGAACVVRPDAALYGASLAAALLVTRPARRSLAAAALAFFVASGPLWLYNLATEGSVLRFTQGSEFRELLGFVPGLPDRAEPAALRDPADLPALAELTHSPELAELPDPYELAALAESAEPADGGGIVRVSGASLLHSGGAFRLANLPRTLPANAAHLFAAFGWFSLLVAVGVAWAVRRAPLLAAALAPYPVVALLFYSCWSHPDTRYLAGAAACLVPLAATGACVLARALAGGGAARGAVVGRVAALALAGLLLLRDAGWLASAVPAAGRAAVAVAFGLGALALYGLVRAGRAGSRADPHAERADARAGHADPHVERADPHAERADARAGHADARAGHADPHVERADPRVEHADPRAGHADPRGARLAPLVPALSLALVGSFLVARSPASRDSFQAAQVEAARRAVAARIPAGSLVVTSANLGRPAENLRHYSGVEAFYAEELPLLGINAEKAALRFVLAGRRAFFLLDARDRARLARLAQGGELRERARVRGRRSLEWYVDPRAAPAGVVLWELEIPEDRQRQYLEYLRGAERGRRGQRGLAAEPEVVLPES